MHSLCASMRSVQHSSPFSIMQASRAFLVSGHAQHGFRGFFCSVPSIAGEASTLAADRLDISTCLMYMMKRLMSSRASFLTQPAVAVKLITAQPRERGSAP